MRKSYTLHSALSEIVSLVKSMNISPFMRPLSILRDQPGVRSFKQGRQCDMKLSQAGLTVAWEIVIIWILVIFFEHRRNNGDWPVVINILLFVL